jgi:rhodanese-related sulfurtransferase
VSEKRGADVSRPGAWLELRSQQVAEETENGTPATGLEVEVGQLAGMIEDGDVEVIDVRRDYEFEAGHLPGARHIEMNDLTASAESLPKDRPVVFYCRTGNRSGMAAEAFAQAGFDAHNLAGGITAWVDLENPLEPDHGTVAEPRPV